MQTPESDLSRLLALQRQAHAADPAPSEATRRDRLQRLGALLDQHAERFTAQISQDFGTRAAAEITVTELVPIRSAIRHARQYLRAWMRPRRAATGWLFWPGHSRLLRQPLGVVGIVSPWNYPLLLALSPLVDVLAAGNRALLKPSELTPCFAEGLRLAVAEFFAPDEVAVLTGDATLGQAFCAQPFDHLVFTGSTAVGRLVAQAAAKNLTPVTLELGGKSPVIVDASCDLGKTMDRLAWGKLINAGQTCIAPDYALVPRAMVGAFADALRASMLRLYPTFQGNPDYTSIASDRHLARLQALVADAQQQGATVVELESTGTGRQMPPVLLLNVHAGMRVLQEEIFGPLLPIVPYDTLDEATAFVNARDKPLALYWFGTDTAHRDQVLAQTQSGGVSINDTLVHLAQDGLPFGGVGPSGQGHYHGEWGFRQFSFEKPVFLQSRWSGGGLVYPPYTPRIQQLLRWLGRRH
ncbi:MAG: coniferyl aldehyde dehydrogenase [Rhodoferax sp.]|uniref:coniferyl aldehyde dehydrogenase n=1 Tax=Rhodoferax sp. TaxID=50421 RepID=UPI003263E6D4